MKKLIIFLCVLCVLFTTVFYGCGSEDVNNSSRIPVLQDDDAEDSMLLCGSGDNLVSYYEKTQQEYLDLCKEYENKGYKVFSSSEKNGNCFTTLVKDKERVHVYWIECEEELNVIYSRKNGAGMPEKIEKTGDIPTTITPVPRADGSVGGYVIQLSDGSFIVYDGGSAADANTLFSILSGLAGNDSFVISAWVLTVSNENRYGCFQQFSQTYTENITLKTVIAAPMSGPIAIPSRQTYLTNDLAADVEKFADAKICYVHTGMTLTFCNVELEVLFTGEEIYICDAPTKDEFENTALVSRIKTENKSAMFVSDCGIHSARRFAIYYGEYLKSDFCTAPQDGSSLFPVYVYNIIDADSYISDNAVSLD